MKRTLLIHGLAMAMFVGCSPSIDVNTPYVDVKPTAGQEAEIKLLIEQLVLADQQASNRPTIDPNMKIFDAKGNEVKSDGDEKKAEEYQERYNSCNKAFQKLGDLKIAAFPAMVAHLDDKRQSINFRNHYLANSVGDACYWNIYYQLQDTPDDYSEYGDGRLGHDGEYHTKPYWEGTPFDEAGGLKQWLEKNKKLSYVQMQIKCLRWLLEKEKAIGASDAESYFINILPLEIRILERRQQAGENVANELARLKKVMAAKDATAVPAELLPAGKAK